MVETAGMQNYFEALDIVAKMFSDKTALFGKIRVFL